MPDANSSRSLSPFFAPRVPPDILARLRNRFPFWPLSSEHPELTLSTARTLLANAADDPDFLPLAGAMLFCAWQSRPLDRETAELLLLADGALGFLPASAKSLVEAAASLPIEPLFNGETGELEAFLRRAPDPNRALSRLAAARNALLDADDPDQGRELLALAVNNVPPSLAARFLAEYEFHRGAPEAAMALLENLDDAWGFFAAWLKARLLAGDGQPDQAAATCAPLWRAAPWRANAALVLHSLVDPVPAARNIAQNEAVVLLYAYNKADMVGQTLASLAKTRLGPSRVLLLDNGSSDDTGDILERSARLFPEGACQVIRLPVNIGAPAARNWLLAHPWAKAAAYAAFLDDDAFPPKRWLEELVGAARKNPGAGAVGCRISDLAPPHRLQTADANLLPDFMGTKSLPGVDERIFVFDSCPRRMPSGHYAYSRPCLSVSGCCHLVNMRAVAETGPFDIRFSPTQFDDLERDMRSWLGGFPTFFHGRLKVRHHQTRSMAKAATDLQRANILGNKAKLEYNFTREEMDRLRDENSRVLWEDLLAKTEALRELYG